MRNKIKNIMKRDPSKNNKTTTVVGVKRSRIHSIRLKLVALLSLVLAIVILGVASHGLASRKIEEITQNFTIQTMDQTKKYLDLIFDEVDGIATQFFFDAALQDYYLNFFLLNKGRSADHENEVARTGIQKGLNSTVSAYDLINSITILTNEKTSFTTSNTPFDKVDWSAIVDTDWYQQALEYQGKGSWIGEHSELDELFFTTGQKDYAFSYVRQYKHVESASHLGVLIIDIDKRAVENLLSGIQIGKTGEMHLITPSGDALTSGSNQVKDEDEDQSEEQLPFTQQPIFEQILGDNKDSDHLYADYRGSEHLVMYSKVEGTGFILVSLIPKAGIAGRNQTNTTSHCNPGRLCRTFCSISRTIHLYQYGPHHQSSGEVASHAANGDLTLEPQSGGRTSWAFLLQALG